MIMNIATALNSRYMRYTYVMLTSLFTQHADTDVTINVYLLHNDLTGSDMECLSSLSEEYGNSVTFIHIDRSLFPESLPTTVSWSLEAYFRLLMTDILPKNLDRILYLDVDMIINQSLTELYNTPFDDKMFVACADMSFSTPSGDSRDEIFKEHISKGFTYFNSGCMLWNLESLRPKYSFAGYMELAKQLNYRMTAPDQDLLNYMHCGQIRFVDCIRYNLFSKIAYNRGVHYEDVVREVAIVHFAGMKPWEGQYIHYDIEKLWWDYAKKTPFYHEFLEEFMEKCISDNLVFDTLEQSMNEREALQAQLNKVLQLLKTITGQ